MFVNPRVTLGRYPARAGRFDQGGFRNAGSI
ncbi:hypothetical protein ABIA39_005823 [Nocardia sp. GAS34]